MVGDDALDLLVALGQTLVLISLVYFLYLVIRFRASQPGRRELPETVSAPAADDSESEHSQETAPA